MSCFDGDGPTIPLRRHRLLADDHLAAPFGANEDAPDEQVDKRAVTVR